MKILFTVLRSIAAVLVTYVLVYVVVMLGEQIIARLTPGYIPGQVPAHLYLIWINTAIYAIATAFCGWLCVLWAPARPHFHLLLLFILGESAGLYFTVAGWGTHPHWISFLWLAVWPIFLWIGGVRLTGNS